MTKLGLDAQSYLRDIWKTRDIAVLTDRRSRFPLRSGDPSGPAAFGPKTPLRESPSAGLRYDYIKRLWALDEDPPTCALCPQEEQHRRPAARIERHHQDPSLESLCVVVALENVRHGVQATRACLSCGEFSYDLWPYALPM